MEEATCLIVGLGNPGKAYEATRHNIGFRIVKAYAEAKRLSFHRVPGGMGDLAKGLVSDKVLFLLLPLTYMNNSGAAVGYCVESFKVPLHHILVVSDDIYLEFGRMRLREKGSSGGHNGLESIIEVLGQEFPRLKIGVGLQQNSEDLADHVLGRFTPEEEAEIPTMIKKALGILDTWVSGGIEKAIPLVGEP